MIGVRGKIQREGEVIHLVADRLEDLTPLLHQVGAMRLPAPPRPRRRRQKWRPDPRERPRRAPALPARRDGGIRIRSRDFH